MKMEFCCWLWNGSLHCY